MKLMMRINSESPFYLPNTAPSVYPSRPTHDSLTGLTNRGEILAMLERELERARRERKPVAVILCDMDHFKNVNDSLGHLFGDEALREIAGACVPNCASTTALAAVRRGRSSGSWWIRCDSAGETLHQCVTSATRRSSLAMNIIW